LSSITHCWSSSFSSSCCRMWHTTSMIKSKLFCVTFKWALPCTVDFLLGKWLLIMVPSLYFLFLLLFVLAIWSISILILALLFKVLLPLHTLSMVGRKNKNMVRNFCSHLCVVICHMHRSSFNFTWVNESTLDSMLYLWPRFGKVCLGVFLWGM
jgi:hypothetical protein